jgi:NAD(P)H-flavin reductase
MARPAEPSPADATLPDAATVLVSRREAPRVITHEIAWPAWPGCAPGQFNMLGLPGLGEVPMSVSGGTEAQGRVCHTIEAVGAVPAALAGLPPGGALTIRGPFGVPWPLDLRPDCPVLIVAGGIGVAALRPLIGHYARKARRGLPVRLVIGARGPNDLVSWRDYDDWRAQGVDLVLTVDHAPPEWPWHVGAVTRFTGRTDGHLRAYVCGPEVMMRATALRLEAQGVPPADIFLSLARTMPCGDGICGRCKVGPLLLCREGPVLSWQRALPLMRVEDP